MPYGSEVNYEGPEDRLGAPTLVCISWSWTLYNVFMSRLHAAVIDRILGTGSEVLLPEHVIKRTAFDSVFDRLVGLGCHPVLLLYGIAEARSAEKIKQNRRDKETIERNISGLTKAIRQLATRMDELESEYPIVALDDPLTEHLRTRAETYDRWSDNIPPTVIPSAVMVNRIT